MKLFDKLMLHVGLAILAIGVALAAASFPVHAAGSVGPSTIPGQAQSQFAPFVRPAPGYTDALVFASQAAQSWPIPVNAAWAVFAATCNFYVNGHGVATVPGSTTSDGSASEVNPTVYFITGDVTAISVIPSTSSCIVTISAYRRAN